MAELSQQERLQPSLLDRLIDDNRHEAFESRDARTITASKLRQCIIRDLSWLLNCTRHWSEEALEHYPYVADSVLNYGIPDLAGTLAEGLDVSVLQSRIHAAIVAYEPRLLSAGLHVTAQINPKRMDHLALTFVIESEMWAQPIPLNLYLRTEVDLETGRFSLVERER